MRTGLRRTTSDKLTRSEMTLVLKGVESYSSSGGKAQENHTGKKQQDDNTYSTLDADLPKLIRKVFVCRRKRRRPNWKRRFAIVSHLHNYAIVATMISDYSSGELLYKNSSSSKGRISSQLSLLNYYHNNTHHNNIPS